MTFLVTSIPIIVTAYIFGLPSTHAWKQPEYGALTPDFKSEQGSSTNYGQSSYGDDNYGQSTYGDDSYGSGSGSGRRNRLSHLEDHDYTTAHLHGPPYPDNDVQPAADESRGGKRRRPPPRRRSKGGGRGGHGPSKGWGRPKGQPDKIVVEHHYYKKQKGKGKRSGFPRLKISPPGIKLIPFSIKVQGPKLKFKRPSVKFE